MHATAEQRGQRRDDSSAGCQGLKRHNLVRGLRQELRDIYYFYIEPERRESLAKMHRLVRWVYVVVWIGMSMLAKLTPLRRLLLVLSLVMAFANLHYSFSPGAEVSINFRGLGFTLLLIVLLLELKDKLLFQNELIAGKAVQEALLPKQNPVLRGWDLWLYTRPANEVGGDLVDYAQLPKGRLAVCLGDVAGKGLGAALCMAKVQATLRALADTTPSLSMLGARLNAILCRDSLPLRFVSLVVVALSARTGKVQVLNAGHLPPLLVKNGQCQELPRGEAALGLTPKTRYRVQRHQLDKGDLLLVYSDGLIECRNHQLEPFGERRLHQALVRVSSRSAREIGEYLMAEVERFVGEARFDDDFSLALLKRTGSPVV